MPYTDIKKWIKAMKASIHFFMIKAFSPCSTLNIPRCH